MADEMNEAVVKLGIMVRLATKNTPYSRKTYLIMLSTFTQISPLTSSLQISETAAAKCLDAIFPEWKTVKFTSNNILPSLRRMAKGISDKLVSELGHPEEVIRRQKEEADQRKRQRSKAKKQRKEKHSRPVVTRQLSDNDLARAARRQERFNS